MSDLGSVPGLLLLALFGVVIVAPFYACGMDRGHREGYCERACKPEVVVSITDDECICKTTRERR